MHIIVTGGPSEWDPILTNIWFTINFLSLKYLHTISIVAGHVSSITISCIDSRQSCTANNIDITPRHIDPSQLPVFSTCSSSRHKVTPWNTVGFVGDCLLDPAAWSRGGWWHSWQLDGESPPSDDTDVREHLFG